MYFKSLNDDKNVTESSKKKNGRLKHVIQLVHMGGSQTPASPRYSLDSTYPKWKIAHVVKLTNTFSPGENFQPYNIR